MIITSVAESFGAILGMGPLQRHQVYVILFHVLTTIWHPQRKGGKGRKADEGITVATADLPFAEPREWIV